MSKRYFIGIEEEGVNMLAEKKKKTTNKSTNSGAVKHAKNGDVLKAIVKSNKKHSEMMKMLAR